MAVTIQVAEGIMTMPSRACPAVHAPRMYELVITNKNYSSWSLRTWALMRELGIAFRERLVPLPDHMRGFDPGTPSGKVPCLVDQGRIVWDTLAIAEYLSERHPGVWPSDAGARAWARCAAAEMHSGFTALRSRCSMTCGVRAKLREIPPDLGRDLTRIDRLWSQGLTEHGGPFLAGAAFTAVDAFYCPVAFRVQTYGLALSEPAAAYARRLLALPSMVTWYEAGIAETWREPDHEAEVTQSAIVIEDFRAS
jgi:glutathione S-transferase